MNMPEWINIGLLVLAYIVVMRWVLPRLGVTT